MRLFRPVIGAEGSAGPEGRRQAPALGGGSGAARRLLRRVVSLSFVSLFCTVPGGLAAGQIGLDRDTLKDVAIACVSSLDVNLENRSALQKSVAKHALRPIEPEEAEDFVRTARPHAGEVALSRMVVESLRSVSSENLEQARSHTQSQETIAKQTGLTRVEILKELNTEPVSVLRNQGPFDSEVRVRSYWWLDSERTTALISKVNLFTSGYCGLIGIPNAEVEALKHSLETTFDVKFESRSYPLIEEYRATVDTFPPLVKQILSSMRGTDPELSDPALHAELTIYRMKTGTSDADPETPWLFAAQHANSF